MPALLFSPSSLAPWSVVREHGIPPSAETDHGGRGIQRIWRRLPADAHAAVAELWAELLLRRLAGRRARSMVASRDHEYVQDRAAALRLQAVVYVRQSTPQQIQNNQESTRRQYDLAAAPGRWAGRRRRSG